LQFNCGVGDDVYKQSMECLNVLLKKQEKHGIEDINFDSGATVGYNSRIKTIVAAQQDVIGSVATRCPHLKFLRR